MSDRSVHTSPLVERYATAPMAALFSDAMGRDMMPELFPPAERAAALYVRLFLRAVDCRTPARAGARLSRVGSRTAPRGRARSHPSKPAP